MNGTQVSDIQGMYHEDVEALLDDGSDALTFVRDDGGEWWVIVQTEMSYGHATHCRKVVAEDLHEQLDATHEVLRDKDR